MAIEASYYGLYLLKYLKDTEDPRQHDHDFINSRADDAAGAFEGERRAGDYILISRDAYLFIKRRKREQKHET